MSDERAARILSICGAIVALAIVCAPILPGIDLPQHIASATYLRRLWDHDPDATARFAWNGATFNAGVEIVAALTSYVASPELGARLFVALGAVLSLTGVARCLRALGLPIARAFFVVPALLGFSFGWGFANFAVGTGLAFVTLSFVLDELRAPRAWRPAAIAALGLVLSTIHPMATLLTAILAASAGLETFARRGGSAASAIATVRAGVGLLVGCGFDLWVASRHLAGHASSYTTVGDTLTPPLWRKVLLFGTLAGGVYGTFVDTALAWLVVGLFVRAAWRRRRTVLVAPAVAMLALYLVVPSVFANTHLVFQRLAQWTIFCLPFVLAPDEARAEKGANVGRIVAIVATACVPLHLAWFAVETRGLGTVLAAVPRGARLTGAIEPRRLWSIRMPVLTHAAALGVPRGASEELFSFARFLGGPVVYREGMLPVYPWPTWEHDGSLYDPATPSARAFPTVLVRLRDPDEPTDAALARLFRGRGSLLARDRGFLLVQTE